MKEAIEAINSAESIVTIQAENPDGDSLGSALALEDILGTLGKDTTLYCAVDIPKYLRYLKGWDRVVNEAPGKFDLSIIVDAATVPLLEKTYQAFGRSLANKPSLVIDHHETAIDLHHEVLAVTDAAAVSSGEVIYKLTQTAGWELSPAAASFLAVTIMSDTLGLSTPNVTAGSIHVLAELVEAGADLNESNEARQALNTKSPEIFKYKGRLFERVELHLDGRLATVTIPWEEIESYSDQYNPSMLVIDEMRLIEGVQLAVAFKTYPDGKITAKLRANVPVADRLAEHFGGGGHQYAAGFKRTDMPQDALMREFLNVTREALEANS